jgi:hypothetical protein
MRKIIPCFFQIWFVKAMTGVIDNFYDSKFNCLPFVKITESTYYY